MSQESVDERIAARAAVQHGLFSFAEATLLGATPSLVSRRVAAGRWRRIRPRVYVLAGVPVTWKTELLAACLREGVVASHRAGATLHELAGFATGTTIEVTALRGVRPRMAGVVVHETSDLARSDVTVVDAIPVTSVARTLIDIAGLAARGELSAEVVAIAFDDAVRSRKASLKWIGARVKERRAAGRAGVPLIEDLLASRRGFGVPDTLFETRALQMLKRAGFPRPTCQFEIFDGDVFVAKVDFAYPHIKLAIEADSFAFHSSPADLERDSRRSNELQALGWDVLHLTWRDLEQPERFLRSLGRYLRAG